MDILKENLSDKYATAFLNLFFNQIDQIQIDNAELFKIFLKSNKKLIIYFELIKDKVTISNIFYKLINKFNLPNIWFKLINLLSEYKRINLLPEIIKKIIELYQVKKNIYKFNVKSAVELNEDAKQAIFDFLGKATKKEIKINYFISKKLIAGIKIYNNKLQWEYTIAKQLKLLKYSNLI